jgi:ubiquinone/menaquinone biosynthesis C-methylase UbiE
MRRPEFIARQSRCPSGPLGWLIGRIMEAETAAENDATLDSLDLQPADRVLEVGFGPGRALERAASRVPTGRVVGIDISQEMSRVAKRRCTRLIRQGRVELHLADVGQLPFSPATFDKAYSVHTVYFWRNPAAALSELYRVLKPGGMLALCFRPKSDARSEDFPETVYRFFDERDLESFLRDARFVDVSIAQVAAASALRIATARA